jgi:uncharacterized protein YndB with AHSA1/START domain
VSKRKIQLERVMDAPPERVYRTWSDPDTMTQWLCYQVQGSLLPGARSVLVFPRQRIEIDVLEAQPNHSFRFRWLHPGDLGLTTEVAVAIRPKGWGSLVTLSDGPYDTANEAILDEYARAIEVWAAGLTQLRASVDYSVDLRTVR